MPPPLTTAEFRACCLLSEVFLDTTLTNTQEQHLSRELHGLGLPYEAVLRLLRNNVFPACYGNLREVAGEWAGFDEAWLKRRINNRQRWAVVKWLTEDKVEQAWEEMGGKLVEQVDRIWKLTVDKELKAMEMEPVQS